MSELIINHETFFSVLITAYNRENLILRALNSLLNQEYQDWEAIIIDDGSNDDTFNVIKQIILENDKIKYYFHKNKGLPEARNIGVRLSRGKYITFLDSDDEYKQNHLSSRFKILKHNPDVHLLYGGVDIIGNPYVPDKNDPSKLIHLDECIIGGTFFIRRDVFEKIGFFKNLPYSDDGEFFERINKNGLKTLQTDIRTYFYHRDNPDSMCNLLKIG